MVRLVGLACAITLIGTPLSGCGQKGPLVLPSPTEAAASAASASR
ncbi:MAG TPA: lipoprotein [Aquabacterium sp.]|nr:lipoprotein [Aquabacterium sp.]HEX5373301.1 lipoprotein [Aquabacterium sp.]